MLKAPTIQQFARSFGTFSPVSGAWKGDAYCYHPHGVIRRPMVYTDHHNVSGACEAQVMTIPTSNFMPRGEGREASIGNSNLSPRPCPEQGHLVIVYRNGEWVGPDGPWRAAMRKDMADVLREIRAIKRADRAKQEQERKARAEQVAEAYQAAAAAFG